MVNLAVYPERVLPFPGGDLTSEPILAKVITKFYSRICSV
jgi:hypothetical protein